MASYKFSDLNTKVDNLSFPTDLGITLISTFSSPYSQVSSANQELSDALDEISTLLGNSSTTPEQASALVAYRNQVIDAFKSAEAAENELGLEAGTDQFNTQWEAQELEGDDNFETTAAVVGLTSSIDEFVHIGREQFMKVFEEALGGVVVFQVECNINQMLEDAGVLPPHNPNLGLEDTNNVELDKLDFTKVADFETLLKSNDGTGTSVEDTVNPARTITGNGSPNDKLKKWWDCNGGSTQPDKLYTQMRKFLGDFFDHDKGLNEFYSEVKQANPAALVMLDDTKIQSQLQTLPLVNDRYYASAGTENNVYHQEFEPKDRTSFALNLLSCRQIAQVLEAFAEMGVGNLNSRVIRTGPTAGPFVYKYRLHKGDSIIGECVIHDSDALSSSKQYSQNVKVQLIQSEVGSYDSSMKQDIDHVATAPGNGQGDGENPGDTFAAGPV